MLKKEEINNLQMNFSISENFITNKLDCKYLNFVKKLNKMLEINQKKN